MAFEIDTSTLYYFLCLVGERYQNLFIGSLRPELVLAFQELDEEDGQAFIKIKIGANLFIVYVDRPLFLVEFDKEGIFNFAGDDEQLELYPEGSVPVEADLPQVIEFPTYFNQGIEPLLDFKLGHQFCSNQNGIWIPLII